MQSQLVRSLEAALASPTIPAEIVTALLNLAEFMEHDEKSLPLDTRCLLAPKRPLSVPSFNGPAGLLYGSLQVFTAPCESLRPPRVLTAPARLYG